MSKYNYNRPPINQEPANATVESVAEAIEETAKSVIGVVHNCYKLNLRAYPAITRSVITTLNSGDEVKIVEEESTDDFYKVVTSSGVEGFCMKEYIEIK